MFDGHNGHACAQLAARHLHTLVREHFEDDPPKAALRSAHKQMSTMMIDAEMDGGTCVVSLFCVDELLFIANCGQVHLFLISFVCLFWINHVVFICLHSNFSDCRCIAIRAQGSHKTQRLTRDHSPALPVRKNIFSFFHFFI